MIFKTSFTKTAFVLLMSFLFFSSNNFAQTKLTLLYRNGKIKGSLAEYLKPNNTIKWTGKSNVPREV